MGYFDLSVSDAARDLRRNTVLTLEKMSVPVEYTFHAAGRSQHGMSLRHAEDPEHVRRHHHGQTHH